MKGTPSSNRRDRVLAYLQKKVWPAIPSAQIGRRLTREEEDAILGYGRGGV